MNFQIEALAAAEFARFKALSDDDLATRNIVRRIADVHPGYPCRVSLEDAAIGERVLLLPYTHLDVDSPYRASHAIFVRENAVTATPAVGEIPAALRPRLLSLRAFDAHGYMLDATVVHGREVEPELLALLGGDNVEFVDIHNAKPGCFAARARQAA